MTLFDTIAHHASQTPHQPALLGSQSVLDYQSLWQQIQQLAGVLQGAGIRRLALQLDNGLPWALIDLACTWAGIVVIPVPHFFSPAQQTWLLDSSGADALVGPEHQGWQAASPLVLMAGRPDEQAVPLWRRIPARLPELPAGTAKITYTSGTTGQPKGVCLSLEQMTAVCGSLALRVAPARVEKHLTLLPLTTLLENLTGLYVPLLTGACSRIPSLGELGFSGSSKLDPAALAQALLRWPSHSLVLVPELLRLLLALCLNTPALATQLGTLRFVAVGGGKVAPELIAHARAAGLPVYEGYGLSECGSVVALNGPPRGSSRQRRPAPAPLPGDDRRRRRSHGQRQRHAGLPGGRGRDGQPDRHRGSGSDRRGGLSPYHGAQEERADHRLWPQLLPGVGGSPGPALPGHRPHRHLR